MKRIGSLLAAVTASFPLEDVRPDSGFSLPLIADALANRYGFQMRPAGAARTTVMAPGLVAAPAVGLPFGFAAQAPISFRNGALKTADRTIAISQLDISIDSDPGSIAVQGATTDAADAVVDDILQALEGDFGFRDITRVVRREYLSTVVVTFDQSVEQAIGDLGAMQQIINATLGVDSVGPFGFERVTFGPDLTAVPVTKAGAVQAFVLERRANHPFSENRYFSSAPLKTSIHFETLERIGAIIERVGVSRHG